MRAQAFVFRSIVLAVLLASAALAQTPASRPFALPESGPTIVRWEPGAPNQEFVIRNGVSYVTLRQGGLSVLVSLAAYDLKLIAWVSVMNGSDHRVEVIPSRITYEIVQPEHTSLIYLDPDKLAASLRHTSRWAYVFAGMAGMGTEQSTTTGTVITDDGRTATVQATTTTRDQAAEDRAIENIHREQERRAHEASDIQGDALRENTLMPYPNPYWTCSGAVWFAFPKHFNFKRYFKQREKKSEEDLTVPVGDYLFVFPFGGAAK